MQKIPYSEAGEKGYLCSLMLSRSAYLGGKRIIGEKHFYDTTHRAIFNAITKLRQDCDKLEFELVKSACSHIPDATTEYLNDIWSFVPTSDNWRFYAGLMLESFDLRRLQQLANTINNEILDPKPDLGKLIDLRKEIYQSRVKDTVGVSAKEAILKLGEELEGVTDASNKSVIPIHLEEVREILPGYRVGQLILVGGFRSSGKSSWLRSTIVREVLPISIPVLIFTFEVSAVEFISGILSIVSKVPISNITFGNLSKEQIKQMAPHQYKVAEYNLHIIDEKMDIFQICATIERWLEDKPGGFIGIDYAQLVLESGKRGKSQEGETSMVGRMLKMQAGTHPHSVIMLLTQLNADGDSKYAKALEEHCNTFIKITPMSDSGKRIIEIEKQRCGPTGEAEVNFWSPTGEFY